jgi:hypothetical protein
LLGVESLANRDGFNPRAAEFGPAICEDSILNVYIKIVRLAAIACAIGTWSLSAQTRPMDEVAAEVGTATLARNIATLMVFDLRCFAFAQFDPAAVKTEINKGAAVGAHKVGRDAFRRFVLEEMAVRHDQVERMTVDLWCRSVGPQLREAGLEVVMRPPSKQ